MIYIDLVFILPIDRRHGVEGANPLTADRGSRGRGGATILHLPIRELGADIERVK